MESIEAQPFQRLEGDHAPHAADAVEAECAATLRFLAAGGVGPGRVASLQRAFGDLRLALQASATEVAAVLRMREPDATRILNEARAADPATEIARVAALGGRIVTFADPEYPTLLRVAPDPPALLMVRGTLPAEPELCVAIVGSRRATAYGRVQAARIAGELAARGIVIVSGGARGIDAEAHRAALRAGGRTIAVVAAGLSHPYPPEHAPLFDAIVEAGGAVLTEQTTDVMPRAELFPRRNRIVAGISVATVVVEAARRSGALVTARIAVEDLSREVGCVPGSVESVSSEGCHAAIREGWARLVTGAEDVVDMLSDVRALVKGALEARTSKNTGVSPLLPSDASRVHGRTADAASDAVFDQRCVNERRGSSERLRDVARDRRSPQPARDSHGVDPIQTKLSQDAQALLEWMLGETTAQRNNNKRRAGGDQCVGVEFRAGLDELEHHLGWSIPRLAAATLSLECAGRIARDPEGAFVLVERYR
jgi:DNA processing protein